MSPLGRYQILAVSIAVVVCSALAVLAFMRRDHKVELVVTYPKSPPAAVWRLLTDHAAEPSWLPAFGSVTRLADVAGQPVWAHTSTDRAFTFTLRTIAVIPEQRYERILLRDDQPRHQSWDGRWIFELQPQGAGSVLRITEYGWSDGFPFFVQQRLLANPDAFLKFYAETIGKTLNDPATVHVVRSH
jgi:uncharacterized protein YndB with AHSA1/START domain